MSLFTIDQGNTNSTIVEWINEIPHRVNEVSSLNTQVLVSNVKGQSFPESFTDIKKFRIYLNISIWSFITKAL